MLQFYSRIVRNATFMIGIQKLLYRNKYLTLDVFQCKTIIFIFQDDGWTWYSGFDSRSRYKQLGFVDTGK